VISPFAVWIVAMYFLVGSIAIGGGALPILLRCGGDSFANGLSPPVCCPVEVLALVGAGVLVSVVGLAALVVGVLRSGVTVGRSAGCAPHADKNNAAVIITAAQFIFILSSKL
jgi:hypothetical protein